MNIESNYRLPASFQSKWHSAPKGCKYRFHFSPQKALKVEWDGEKPDFFLKSFWKKYARRRDDFLIESNPEGDRILSVCFFTGKTKTLIGKGLPK